MCWAARRYLTIETFTAFCFWLAQRFHWHPNIVRQPQRYSVSRRYRTIAFRAAAARLQFSRHTQSKTIRARHVIWYRRIERRFFCSNINKPNEACNEIGWPETDRHKYETKNSNNNTHVRTHTHNHRPIQATPSRRR